jgi:hypothetical protein
MEYIVGTVIVIALLLGFNAKEWIETYWNGKAEVAREDRKTAEARAREAEAKLAQSRLDSNRM